MFEVAAARMSSQSRHSARTVRTNRSAYAFAGGARIGVWITLISFAAEHLVEGGAELAVSVVDQEPCPLEAGQ